MNSNPFYIQPGGIDTGGGLAGLGAIINQKKMQDRDIALQDEQLNRQREFQRAQADAFGPDPETMQPVMQPTQEEGYAVSYTHLTLPTKRIV